MSEKPVYVVSDIHLGAVPASTERSFRRFLEHVAREGTELLINGDLFDFWFEYRSVIHGRHYRVLAALADLREAGVRIRFIGGNHDAWGGPFLEKEIGIEILEEGVELELAGFRALVVHGDGVGSGDIGYKALKRLIRNPLAIRAFRLLHPDWGARLASLVSSTEAKTHGAAGANPERAAELNRWAAGVLERRIDLDLILAGHTHTPIVDECRPGVYYVNTGDWLSHFTYLELVRGNPPRLGVWATP
ncbi:MAG: UDP-2,3-diacylglucosamine diphosphatase [Gemmatimonadota bacterium]